MLATIVVLYGNAAAKRCRFWLQDESRFGLKTVTRRRVTSRGVRPVSKVQWQFEAYWLYGLAEPLTGETFFLEFLALSLSKCHMLMEPVFRRTLMNLPLLILMRCTEPVEVKCISFNLTVRAFIP